MTPPMTSPARVADLVRGTADGIADLAADRMAKFIDTGTDHVAGRIADTGGAALCDVADGAKYIAGIATDFMSDALNASPAALTAPPAPLLAAPTISPARCSATSPPWSSERSPESSSKLLMGVSCGWVKALRDCRAFEIVWCSQAQIRFAPKLL